LEQLPPDKAIILKLRFGLFPGGEEKGLTLEQVGVLFGVTRERIRQIESKALGLLEDGKGTYKTYYRPKNQIRWEAFCRAKNWDSLDIDVMNMRMGWDKETLYKKSHDDVIFAELKRRHGVELSEIEMRKRWHAIETTIFKQEEPIWLLETVSEREGFALVRKFLKRLMNDGKGSEDPDDDDLKDLLDFPPAPLDVDWANLAERVKDVQSHEKAEQAAARKTNEEIVKPKIDIGRKKKVKMITEIDLSDEQLEAIIDLEDEITGEKLEVKPLEKISETKKVPLVGTTKNANDVSVNIPKAARSIRRSKNAEEPEQDRPSGVTLVKEKRPLLEVKEVQPVNGSSGVSEIKSELLEAIGKIFSGEIQIVATKIFWEKKKVPEVVSETKLPANKVMMLSTMARIRLNEIAPELLKI